jgi:hypothetical protein
MRATVEIKIKWIKRKHDARKRDGNDCVYIYNIACEVHSRAILGMIVYIFII